jgi:hypothetical protein
MYAGASNYGIDTLMLLEILGERPSGSRFMWLLIQSKKSASDGHTQTYAYAMAQMKSNLTSHGNALHVEGVHKF